MLTDEARIDNMLLSISRIRSVTNGITEEQFMTSWEKQDLCRMHFSMLGEDAKRLSDVVKSTHPEIPWRSIAAMRNIIMHDYLQTDYRIILEAAKNNLDSLEKALLAMKAGH